MVITYSQVSLSAHEYVNKSIFEIFYQCHRLSLHLSIVSIYPLRIAHISVLPFSWGGKGELCMNEQILIECGSSWFAFSQSKTGQLDYCGKADCRELPDLSSWQQIASSTYFTPRWYTYLPDSLLCSPRLYVAPGVDVSDKDTFSFLLHIGAVLAAMEAGDSLLAGELYLRRTFVFEKFAQLVQYILEPRSVEILFSLCYGRLQSVDPDSIPLIFSAARKRLGYKPEKETLDQAFMRYFQEHQVTVTMPVVGMQHHDWEPDPMVLHNLTNHLDYEDLPAAVSKIRRAKHDLYASLETAVQAEPYNPVDPNAIAVCIEDLDAKIWGNPGLEKAGYIRAMAAKVIREAKEERLSYGSSLARLSGRDIVVKMVI